MLSRALFGSDAYGSKWSQASEALRHKHFPRGGRMAEGTQTEIFKSVLEKFELYLDKMETDNPFGFNMYLAIEVRKRIEQLNYLYKLIEEKNARFMELNWREYHKMEALRKEFPYGRIVVKKSEDRLEMDRLFLRSKCLPRVSII
jgi:hypothetical protein